MLTGTNPIVPSRQVSHHIPHIILTDVSVASRDTFSSFCPTASMHSPPIATMPVKSHYSSSSSLVPISSFTPPLESPPFSPTPVFCHAVFILPRSAAFPSVSQRQCAPTMSTSDSKPGSWPTPPQPRDSPIPPSTLVKRTGFRLKFSSETTASDSRQISLPPEGGGAPAEGDANG